MRRYRWLLVLACVAIGVLLVAWWAWAGNSRFTRAQYERIHLGMTREEVNAVMGCEPTNYLDVLFQVRQGGEWEEIASNPPNTVTKGFAVGIADWMDNAIWIRVGFDNGRTVRTRLSVWVPPWKRQIRDWLSRL